MRKIKKIFRWIQLRVPVSMGTHADMIMANMKEASELKKAFRKELEETKKTIDKALARLSKIDVDKLREPPHYVVHVEFDHRMFSGKVSFDEQKLIAERMGRQVEHEISISRFVQSPRHGVYDEI